jgi:hypothetical protein
VLVDLGDEPVDDGADFAGALDEVDDPFVSEVVDVEPLDESDEFESDELESVDPLFDESELEPGGVVAFDPRLSVLKNPEPLKVTPTGWNTFFTGRTSPDPGWAYSVRESSVNACWTSMVSQVSTNL